MKISGSTKIATLIKANPAAIDAIASISPHFKKLYNPILRKLLASRVTINDAAKIGGCSPEDFFSRLRPLGFEPVNEQNTNNMHPQRPAFMETANETEVLDVRPFLAEGRDPFHLIMNRLKEISPSKVLLLINSFHPSPLLKILECKGYEHYTEEHEGVSYSYIKPPGKQADAEPLNPETVLGDIGSKKKEFGDRLKTLDVRQFEMPGPMVAILNALDDLPADTALHVQHRRVPYLLFPELQLRNFTCMVEEIAEGNVELLIFK